MTIITIHKTYTIIDKNGIPHIFNNGIEYTKYLRKIEKSKDPIIFTSFLSLGQVLRHVSNAQIIQAIGHGFIRLPYTDEELQDVYAGVNPLTDLQLTDVIINYCQIRSAVRESFHILKGKLSQLQNSKDDKTIISNMVIALFENYKHDLKRDVPDYPQVVNAFDAIIQKFDSNDLSTLDAIRNQQEETLTAYLPAEDDNEEERINSGKNWEVLFLDDRPDELSPIFEILDKRGIQYHIKTSAADAEAKISADLLNKITVVVSDYRLFEPDTKDIPNPRMQPKQGYDFLIDLSKRNDRYNALIALSGLSKWFLMESFRKEQIDVKVYSKGGLLGGGHKLFVDDLEYLGDMYFDVICSQPQCTVWTKDELKGGKIENNFYKRYYVFHRKHSSYHTYENDINFKAEKAARELEFAMENKDEFHSETTVNIKQSPTECLRETPEIDYDKFQNKLLQRRVYYYLLLKGYKKEAIAEILNKNEKKKSENISDSMVKQVLYRLAITSSDIPFSLLVEEKYFLQHYMGIPINSITEILNSTHFIFTETINEYLAGLNYSDALKNYVASDGKTLISVSMNDLGTLLNKVVDLLKKQKKEAIALDLINKIREQAENLFEYLTNDKQLPELLKKMDKLEESINIKITR